MHTDSKLIIIILSTSMSLIKRCNTVILFKSYGRIHIIILITLIHLISLFFLYYIESGKCRGFGYVKYSIRSVSYKSICQFIASLLNMMKIQMYPYTIKGPRVLKLTE